MNPLRIKGSGYGRFPEFDVAIPLGETAIIGGNGAGKSRLLNAIELALFADGGRDLSMWLGPNTDRLELELTFDHAEDTYRVRRSYRQTGSSGKITLDFERLASDFPGVLQNDSDWETLTRETTSATQQLIIETIGLSRRTFGASAFLAQGDAAAFPEMSPADRKAGLGEIVDPRGLWSKLSAKAKAESLTVGSAISADLTKIGERETLLQQFPNVETSLAGFREGVTLAEQALAPTEAALEAAQAELAGNAAASERVRSAETERNQASTVCASARDAVAKCESAITNLPPEKAALARIDEVAGNVTLLEQKLDNQRNARAAMLEASGRRSELVRQADELEAEKRRHDADIRTLVERNARHGAKIDELQDADDHAAICDRCEQTLGAEARAKTIGSLVAERATIQTEIDEKTQIVRDLDGRIAEARNRAAAVEIPTAIEGDFEHQLADARSAAALRPAKAQEVATLEEQAGQLDEATAALAAAQAILDAKNAALVQASQDVKDDAQLTRAVEERKAAVATARRTLDAARADVTRLETEQERLNTAKSEIDELRRSAASRQTELDLLKLAEKAFGRDGIPVLLVENIIPQIEAEANRILDQLPTVDGDTFRVELRTQREQKTTDNLKETLDIVVSDRDGERAYETYSGGERARLNIALRIGLARLLANRRGAESRLLAIDELEYLDELGQEKLVDVIRSVSGDFDRVIVVSHSPNVRDAFSSVIQIVKTDGVSRVVGVPVLEEAIA